MDVKDLLELHEELCEKSRAIMEAKNHDYTSGSGDPFANFRATEAIGVKAELGILIRVLDKMQRLRTFAEQGKLLVPGEGAEDAVTDVINYMILLAGLMKERGAE